GCWSATAWTCSSSSSPLDATTICNSWERSSATSYYGSGTYITETSRPWYLDESTGRCSGNLDGIKFNSPDNGISIKPTSSSPNILAAFRFTCRVNGKLCAAFWYKSSCHGNPTAAGIWHTGAHIAGVNHPAPDSTLETLPFQQRWYPNMAGAVLPSIASSSANPSASNSEPALQTSSANPIFMAAQQGPSPHTAFHNHPGPLNATAGFWNTGTHIAGVNTTVSESTLETLAFQQRWHPDMAGAVLPSIASSLANPSASNSEP
ncbi:hypothetical protein EJB05_25531, partial [Eragrostis curvula]